jgi:hypothetical protein
MIEPLKNGDFFGWIECILHYKVDMTLLGSEVECLRSGRQRVNCDS